MSFILFSFILKIYYYKIPDGIDLVTVEVSSESDGCTIVSVQNNTVCGFILSHLVVLNFQYLYHVQCPVSDLFENARSKGIYQTMTTSAFLMVKV